MNAFMFITFPYPDKNLEDEVMSFIKFLREKYKNLHLFFIPYWYKEGVYQYNMLKNYCNSFIILANSEEEKSYYDSLKLNNIYCNQNCWIDYDIYKIKNYNKKYDFVYNANNSVFKNHKLLKNICKDYDIMYITYDIPVLKNYDAIWSTVKLEDYNPKKIAKHISDEDVSENLNECKLGIFLSTTEGACYSSSEYLLCGLPVISVKSNGGRDVWFNDKNSIIINNKEDELKNSIDFILNNIDQYDSNKIREEHINKQIYFRKIFAKYLKTILYFSDLELDPKEMINNNFSNKMLDVRG